MKKEYFIISFFPASKLKFNLQQKIFVQYCMSYFYFSANVPGRERGRKITYSFTEKESSSPPGSLPYERKLRRGRGLSPGKIENDGPNRHDEESASRMENWPLGWNNLTNSEKAWKIASPAGANSTNPISGSFTT